MHNKNCCYVMNDLDQRSRSLKGHKIARFQSSAAPYPFVLENQSLTMSLHLCNRNDLERGQGHSMVILCHMNDLDYRAKLTVTS